jgi:hypothetical protein
MIADDVLFAPHPLYPLPTREELERDYSAAEKYLEKRAGLIRAEEADPFRCGFVPEVWALPDKAIRAGKRELLILGGNRSSKSYYAARKSVETLLSGPKKVVWCLQTTFKNSVEMQQKIVWHYLPPEFKNLSRGRITNVSYTQKTGFSEAKFVLPNASECVFRHYSQAIEVIEGGDVDLCWCDELVPLSWIETLRYRTLSRKGVLLITFTPVQQWSPTVAEYLEGARTVSYAEAPLLPKGMRGRVARRVPREQQPLRVSAFVVYFHIADNPFTSAETAAETLDGAPVDEILMRAYGVPAKSGANRFPRFRETLHVLPHEEIMKRIEGATRYHLVDPASGRNWFMLWVAVDPPGTHYVYREWPDYGTHGDWAVADGRLADGKLGLAQESYGWGIRRYLEEIERLETGEDGAREEIAARWIDSVFSAMPTQTVEGGTTLLEELALLGEPFSPAPKEHIDEGVSLINNLLDFERGEDDKILESPKLYLSETCGNTIFALKLWTGRDHKYGACKDPIDCLRFMACARLCGFTDADLMIYAGGHY